MDPDRCLSRLLAPWRQMLSFTEAELLPCRCPFCGTSLHGTGVPVCAGCRQELPRNRPACRRCAMPLGTASGADCARCQSHPPPFVCTVAPFAYEYPLDAAIRAMKFRRRLYYLPAFSRLLLDAARNLPEDVDAVLPVPLHRRRLVSRGFNQASELARPLGRALGLPLVGSVQRARHTAYQSGLAPADRRRNLDGAFRLVRSIEARHVLIVDDVVTTGTTCAQLGALLAKHGVARISVLALARALGD